MVESIIWERKKSTKEKHAIQARHRRETKRLRDVEELWKERKWRQKKIAFNERFYIQLSIWSIVNDHFCQFLFCFLSSEHFSFIFATIFFVIIFKYFLYLTMAQCIDVVNRKVNDKSNALNCRKNYAIYVSYSMSFKCDNFNTLWKYFLI